MEEKRAADNALASAVIEGFVPDQAFMALWDQLSAGEISQEEYHAIITKRALDLDRQLELKKEQRLAVA